MTTPSLEEIINVQHPLLYNCRLWGYVPGHSQLLIRANKDNFLTGNTFFLGFETVAYWEGPVSWTGVDFKLGSSEECKEIIRKANIVMAEDLMGKFLQTHHLFKIDRLDCRVRIFAWNIYKVQDVPEIFSGSPKV